ncbi:MAG TPA: DDE-type integrase/transposase/recombinase [Nitrososphaerales archaeon]|nr:DDE-type integrase/transposase/recombinase [Nitrososphaerales archaeon]
MSAPAFDYRMARGEAIAKVESNVRRIDQNEYRVKSQSGNGEYVVLSTELGWDCSCPDHSIRQVKCKHIIAVELSLEIRRRIENAKRIVPLDYQSCLCGSEVIVKDGLRHNRNGDIQRFTCRECGRRFARNLGFERMGATSQAITGALQLYFSGESLRSTQKFLRLQGVNVSHQTVHNWIAKYVGLMEKYLDQITPNVSDTWRADEMYVKFKGNMKFLFAMMDNETRFWIAQEVSDTKERTNARHLLSESRRLMGKKPATFITDGMEAYHVAWRKEYRNLYNPNEVKTVHIRHITLKGDHNNNRMERMNGEVRDREKVMRGLKRTDSPIIKGYQLYHNYFRPHMALKGKTPAEAAGITIEGENKWETVIRNAAEKHQPC